MQNSHIIQNFDQAISALRGEVLSMAGKTRYNLERAIRALMQRNVELANAVIADDDEIDELERKVDKLGMDMLVRYHPLASDLRLVISSMKISMNLERISDHATSIAKRARKLAAHQELADAVLVEPLHALADALLRDAITAYSEHDAALALGLHERDKEINQLHKKITATYSKRIEESGERSEDYLHLVLVTRSLERIGDLSVNIGEDTVFLEAAKDVRHEDDRHL
ncbi:MAG TPA: phosphate signaling complex protein PhoU [Luteolibacter sp.]|nr:phosphate signaling complex protein PhoU [Luteolibacter sp.]